MVDVSEGLLEWGPVRVIIIIIIIIIVVTYPPPVPGGAALAAVVVVSCCTPQSSAGSLKTNEHTTMSRSVNLMSRRRVLMRLQTCSNQSASEILAGRRRKPHSTAVCDVTGGVVRVR